MSAGCFLLAFIPENASHLDIAWRLMMCGAGFGFFQSPNNHMLLSSAPNHRAGSAGGMLATARLVGQSTGAALVALFFHLFGDHLRRPFLCQPPRAAFSRKVNLRTFAEVTQ